MISKLSERRNRAVEEGKLARSLGKSKIACPYHSIAITGLRHFWLMGWEQQRYAEESAWLCPRRSRCGNTRLDGADLTNNQFGIIMVGKVE